jgi:hypothetical protein
MKIAGIVVLAVLTGWLARGIQFEDAASPPSPATPVVVEKSEPVAQPPAVIVRALQSEASVGNRNLFAYRVHEERPLPAAGPLIVTPEPVAAPAPAAVEVATVREPVPFPWRYIGTVGAAHNRVAAFKRDGDILTVRTGERVGDFVLRSIGLESVEVEGPDGARRIPLASDL